MFAALFAGCARHDGFLYQRLENLVSTTRRMLIGEKSLAFSILHPM